MVGGSGARSDNTENNIFYDEAGGDGSSRTRAANTSSTTSSTIGAAHRVVRWGGGATPPFIATDPTFVSTGSSVGVGANYTLCVAGQNGCTATSLVGHTGVTIQSVPNDYLGNLRSNGYSMGAVQMMN